MLQFDKKTILDLESKNVEKIRVFFYNDWCSWTKVDLLLDKFDLTNDLKKLELSYNFEVYIEWKDKEKFKDCIITRVIKSDHTGCKKIRYIFSSKKVKDRCNCWSSFSFEEKKPVLDLEKLKNLKVNFGKTNIK